MNLTINVEISEQQLKAIVTEQASAVVKQLVISKIKSWGEESRIKSKINELYNGTVSEMIAEELEKNDVLREKVVAEITAKLRRELARAMKAGEKV